MAAQPTLRPSDLAVACQLAIEPGQRFLGIASATGISAGECHNAVGRLRISRLILPDERRPATELLGRFLAEGAPFAFPPVIGGQTIGIATAQSSPLFAGLVEARDGFVWPCADGTTRGRSIVPLFPGAPKLKARNPRLYEILTIVDALRVGTARVRTLASELLADRLAAPAA